ncbi:MAG: hypothetical protein ACK5LT_13470 [Lachnospirales bacterium]
MSRFIKNTVIENKIAFTTIFALTMFILIIPAVGFIHYYDSSRHYYFLPYTMITTVLTFTVAIIFASLFGALKFFYLYKRQSVDFYHSLPITREKLFLKNYIQIILIVLVPFLFTLLINLAINVFIIDDVNISYNVFIIFTKSLLSILLFYNLIIFLTIICGNAQSFILNLIGMIFSFFILIITFFIFINNIFNIDYYLYDVIYSCMLIYTIENGDVVKAYSPTTFPYIFTILFNILLFLGNIKFFALRKGECYNSYFSSNTAKRLFKTFYCVAMGLLITLLLLVNLTNDFNFSIYTYPADFFKAMVASLIVMFVFYNLSEYIATKDITILKVELKYFIYSTLAYCIIVIALIGDVFKLNYYLPNTDKIKSITLNQDYYNPENNSLDALNTFEDQENIKTSLSLINTVKDTVPSDPNTWPASPVYISIKANYTNFSLTKSFISKDDRSIIEKFFAIYSSEEYKDNMLEILNSSKFKSLDSRFYKPISEKAIGELHNALMDDVKNDQNFTSCNFTEPYLFFIKLGNESPPIYLPIKITYTNTLNLYKELGKFDIDKVEIYEGTLASDANSYITFEDILELYRYDFIDDTEMLLLGESNKTKEDFLKEANEGYIDYIEKLDISTLYEPINFSLVNSINYLPNYESSKKFYAIYYDEILLNGFADFSYKFNKS